LKFCHLISTQLVIFLDIFSILTSKFLLSENILYYFNLEALGIMVYFGKSFALEKIILHLLRLVFININYINLENCVLQIYYALLIFSTCTINY
jgi:hypothetical protein